MSKNNNFAILINLTFVFITILTKKIDFKQKDIGVYLKHLSVSLFKIFLISI